MAKLKNKLEPILYSDSSFVTTNEFGFQIDFAQRLGATNKHTVVHRIGGSKRFMLELINKLKKVLTN